jgi:hypothetical protein
MLFNKPSCTVSLIISRVAIHRKGAALRGAVVAVGVVVAMADATTCDPSMGRLNNLCLLEA